MDTENYQLFLAPFCTDSVLLHHRLLLDGISIRGYFDKNPLKENQMYLDVYIHSIYFLPHAKVIICNAGLENEIRAELTAVGYTDQNILCMDEIALHSDAYRAAMSVDLDRFVRLMPAHLSNYNSGYLKIRKLRRLAELGAPTATLNYERLCFPRMAYRYENYLDEHNQKRLFLQRIEIDVGPACNLKCRYCANLMQYFERPYLIPAEEVIRDYRRMMELIEWMDDVMILGGEPFLNRELDKIIDAINEHPDTEKKVGRKLIVTNGTILPNKRTLASIKRAGFVVWISNYRNHSRRLGELVLALQKQNILFSVNNSRWSYVNQLSNPEDTGKDRLMEIREECVTRHRAVSHGKFYLCCFINGAEKLSAVPYNPDNHVDIYAYDAAEQIYDYLDRAKPMPEACLWCSENRLEDWEQKEIPAAEQTSTPLPYKKF